MQKYHLKNLWWLIISVMIIILDHWTKLLAVQHLTTQSIYLTSWFNLTLGYNTGAAFSFLSDMSGWQRWFLVAFNAIVGLILVIWLLRTVPRNIGLSLGLALIIGGGIGNLWDRFMLGHVIDFIQWHVGAWSWPIFNVADSAICVGVGLLLIDLLFFDRKRKQEHSSS